jgi:hypothetical protein
LNNVYPDATKFFDSIMEDKEITSRAELIRNNFDKILGDDEKKDPEYDAACQLDNEEIRKGNYNFEGAMPIYNPIPKA